MNNKAIIIIAAVIAVMVSIIAYIQALPYIEQYQKELSFKEQSLKQNQCINEARAVKNFTKWEECLGRIP
jgi:hypothetical protein